MIENFNFSEEIFGDKFDRQYKEYTQEETKLYLQALRKENSKRMRSDYLRNLFDTLYRGVDADKVFFAECTASIMVAKMQYMVSSILLPLSGIWAVGRVFGWLYQKVTNKTALDALQIGGVYMPNKDKLFVFIKNQTTNIINDKLLFILLHELCHMCSKLYSTLFKSLFYNEYVLPFYIKYFQYINDMCSSSDGYTEMTKEEIEYAADLYATTLLDIENTNNTKTIGPMFRKMDKVNRKFTEFVYMMFCEVLENNPRIKGFVGYLYFKIYHELGIHIPEIFSHYQETMFPSEIVCIASFVHNKRPKFIKMLQNMFV